MAAAVAAVTAALSVPYSKSSSLPTRTSVVFPERISFTKRILSTKNVRYTKNVRVGGEVVSKVVTRSKKDVEGLVEDKFTPDNPFIGICLRNSKITGDDSPVETHHIVFDTKGEIPYREGQSIGIIPDGVDEGGKPHRVRTYLVASSRRGDDGDSKTVSLCVKRRFYTDEQGETIPEVSSNFLCDLKPGAEVKITGPMRKELLMPVDPNATIIMVATGTGIAPFRAFLWKMFFEEHENYKFNGLAWLFFGVPTSSSLLYKEELEKIKETATENFRLDLAISREQTNENGEKMYIQNRWARYGDEIWELLQKDNTFVYISGLKEMEEAIDDVMDALAASYGVVWADFKEQLVKEEQWSVEVY